MDDSGGFGAPPPPPPPSAGGGGSIPQRGLGDILSAAFDVYKANATNLIMIVAIVVVPLSFISHFFTGVVFKPTTQTVTFAGQTISTTTTRSFGTFILASLIAAAITVIISAALQAALVRGAALATVGDPIDVEASYRYGFRRFGSVVWISLLMSSPEPVRAFTRYQYSVPGRTVRSRYAGASAGVSCARRSPALSRERAR